MEKVIEVKTPPQVASETDSLLTMTKKINSKKSKLPVHFVLIGVVVVFLGIGSGWFLSRGASSQGNNLNTPKAASNTKITSTEAGLKDASNYDTVQGNLEEGGIAGEGAYHLVRPGGDSQNVYLTSTVIDLDSFKGKKVQVWGQTIKGKKAGWLMDVVKVKIVE